MHPRITTILRTVSLALLLTGFFTTVQAQTRAYVANSNLHNVSVIDTATNTVLTTIAVGTRPSVVLASPDGSRVYVLNATPNFSVSVINTATNAVTATIPTPGGNFFMAMSADGSRLYVSDQLFPSSGVSVVDTASNSVVGSIALPAGGRPRGLSVSPDGTRLYIADLGSPNVYIADTATNTVVDSIAIPSGAGTTSLILSRDGSRLFVGNGNAEGELGVFDTATKALVASLSGGIGIIAQFSITPDGGRVYGTGIVDGGPYLTIDTATLNQIVHAPVDGAWVYAGFSPDSSLAYITDYLHNLVAVVDNTTDALITTIPVGGGLRANPWGIAVTALPPTTPFAQFSVSKLELKKNGFQEAGGFTVAAGGSALDPVTQIVTFTIGSYTQTIPAGSFSENGHSHWKFQGDINDVKLNIQIDPHANSTTQFDFKIDGKGLDLSGQRRPINAGLKIGNRTGSVLVP